jgi:hypothetical protein
MLGFRATHFLVAGTGAVLLFGACPQAIAFDPQPESPGQWRVEGFIDLSALTMESTNVNSPFGIDPAIVGDGQTDFSAGIIATFTGTDRDGDGRPDDAVYTADLCLHSRRQQRIIEDARCSLNADARRIEERRLAWTSRSYAKS